MSGPCGALCQATCVDPFVGLGNTFLPASPRPGNSSYSSFASLPGDLCSPSPAPGACPTWEQCTADHAWHDDQAHRQHLEVAGQDGACFGVVQVPGRQRPLHDDLGAMKAVSPGSPWAPVTGLLPGEPQGEA